MSAFQQLAPLPVPVFKISRPPGMLQIKGINQAVQKTAPRLRTAPKQPIHLRRNPIGGNIFSQFALRRNLVPVYLNDSPLKTAAFVLAFADSFLCRRSDFDFFKALLNRCRNRPAEVGNLRRSIFVGYQRRSNPFNVGQPCAAQSAPRRQKGNRLQNVGLARTVFPGNNDRAGSRADSQKRIVSEIS